MVNFAKEIAEASKKDENSIIVFEVQKVYSKDYDERNIFVQVTIFDEEFEYLDSFCSPLVYANIQPVLNEIAMTKMILVNETETYNYIDDIGVVTLIEKADENYEIINHGILDEEDVTCNTVLALFENHKIPTLQTIQ